MRMHLSSQLTRPLGSLGFTLTEVMISVAILMVVTAALITSHLFGLRMHELTKVKLGVNEDSRQALSILTEEIRTAKSVKIGSGTLTAFTEVARNVSQTANAIQVYPTS